MFSFVTIVLWMNLCIICRVPKGGVFKGGGNWGTLRIPREDWGTLGNIGED